MYDAQISLAVIAVAIFSSLVWIVLKGAKDERLRNRRRML